MENITVGGSTGLEFLYSFRSQITINKSKFQNNSLRNTIYFTESSIVQLETIFFTSEESIESSIYCSKNTNFQANNLIFEYGKYEGSVIASLDSEIFLLNQTIFQHNYCEYGGEIYSACKDSNYYVNLTNLLFLNNTSTTSSAITNEICSILINSIIGFNLTNRFLQIDSKINLPSIETQFVTLSNFNLSNVIMNTDRYGFIEIDVHQYANISLTNGSFYNISGDAYSIININDPYTSIYTSSISNILIDNIEFYHCDLIGISIIGNANILNSFFTNGTISSALLLSGNIYLNNITVLYYSSPFPTESVISLDCNSIINIENSNFKFNIGVAQGSVITTICNTTQIYLKNSLLYGNSATSGGVIYISNGILSIENSNFLNNFGSNGGVIYSNSGNISIISSNFTQNLAINGGAIYILGTTSLKIFNNTLFNNNLALQEGGAIMLLGTSSTSLFSYVLFNNNTSIGNGGAISISNQFKIIMEYCTLENNEGLNGGAISLAGNSKPNFQYCIIQSNHAYSSGGGVFIKEASSPLFNNTIIQFNSVDSNGGGFKLTDNSFVSMYNISIYNNTSPNEGGGLSIADNSYLYAEDPIISKNIAGSSGGGISFSVTSSANITRGIISENIANSKGGGVSLANNCFPIFNYVLFSDNLSSEGGALLLRDSSSLVINEGSFLLNNGTSTGGAVVALDFSKFNCYKCNFKGNQVLNGRGRGGALYLADFANITVNISNFENNSAQIGGAIYSTSTLGPIVDGGLFQSNKATDDGGAIVIAQDSIAIIKNIICSDNIAINRGGCIISMDDAAPTIINSTMINNQAFMGGGIACEDISKPNITNCLIRNNTAFQGGGIHINQLSAMSLFNSTIDKNSAYLGGGIYSTGSIFNVKSTNITFNEGNFGGGIYLKIDDEGEIYSLVTMSNFIGNMATRGGGIFLTDISVGENSTFSLVDNYLIYDQIEVINFNNNDDNTNNNIYIDQEEKQNNKLQNNNKNNNNNNNRNNKLKNKREKRGEENLNFSFTNTTFINNIAEMGGGIYNQLSNGDITFGPITILINNSATSYGGALFLTHSHLFHSEDVWMTGSYFNLNYAEFAGTNVGWSLSTLTDTSSFCEKCFFGDANLNFTGYQTKEGWASPPSSMQFYDRCPANLYLNNQTFNITIGLEDNFETLVIGPVVSNSSIILSIIGNCSLNSPMGTEILINSTNGLAEFFNLFIQSKNNTECKMTYAIDSIGLSNITCNITVANCPSGYEVVIGDVFDYCQGYFFILFLLFLFIIYIFIYLFIYLLEIS